MDIEIPIINNLHEYQIICRDISKTRTELLSNIDKHKNMPNYEYQIIEIEGLIGLIIKKLISEYPQYNYF